MLIRTLSILLLLLLIPISQLSAQGVAPDFAYHDKDGEISTLWEDRGEVTYISFWASWCKPCLRNFKKYESIRSCLQEKGVKLLNVNIDDNRAVWLSTLQTQDILGTNVWASDFEQIQDDYEIYNIPQYEIVDRIGHLVYLPDDPNRSILEAFDHWLED